jgi:purine-binding chemotaxis protein CheW
MEVSYLMQLNELPVTDSSVLGLMTMRDEVFPVIDLRIRFGTTNPEYKLDTPIIAARSSHGIVGLLVDNADTVENVAETDTIAYQENNLPFLSGAVKLAQDVLLLLDLDQLTAKV